MQNTFYVMTATRHKKSNVVINKISTLSWQTDCMGCCLGD